MEAELMREAGRGNRDGDTHESSGHAWEWVSEANGVEVCRCACGRERTRSGTAARNARYSGGPGTMRNFIVFPMRCPQARD